MNTRSKRASSVGFWKPYVMALPLPDGAISQGDRQNSVWDYSGILAGAVIVPVFRPGSTVQGPAVSSAIQGPADTDRIRS